MLTDQNGSYASSNTILRRFQKNMPCPSFNAYKLVVPRALISFECSFYIAALALVYIWLIPQYGDSAANKCFGYVWCARHLKPTHWLSDILSIFGIRGWIYFVDESDGQWHHIRDNLQVLWGCVAISAIGRAILSASYLSSPLKSDDAAATKRLAVTTQYFRVILGLGFVFVLHGKHVFIVIGICASVYFLSTISSIQRNSSLGTVFNWAAAIAILLLKESYRMQNRFPVSVCNYAILLIVTMFFTTP